MQASFLQQEPSCLGLAFPMVLVAQERKMPFLVAVIETDVQKNTPECLFRVGGPAEKEGWKRAGQPSWSWGAGARWLLTTENRFLALPESGGPHARCGQSQAPTRAGCSVSPLRCWCAAASGVGATVSVRTCCGVGHW